MSAETTDMQKISKLAVTCNRNTKRDNVPDGKFAELGFQFLISWCLNVEHGEGASNIKEQGPEGKPSPGTYPVSRHQKATRATACAGSYRLPVPKIRSSGSFTEGSNFPSFKNRSGSYVCGEGYTASS